MTYLAVKVAPGQYMEVSPGELRWRGDGTILVLPFEYQAQLLAKMLQEGIYGPAETGDTE